MNNNNNNRRHNNNNRNRFQKNNNFKKRPGGNSFGRGSDFEETEITPQQRRHFEHKRDQHLAKAKEYLASGDRVEAENHFQHADHFFRMMNLGLDRQQQQQQAEQQQSEQTHEEEAENTSPAPEAAVAAPSAPASASDELPVDMMGRFPQQKPKTGKAAVNTAPNDMASLPFMKAPKE